MAVLCEDDRVAHIEVDPLALIHGAETATAEIARAVEQTVALLKQPRQPRAILLETALHGDLLDLDAEDRRHGYARGVSANCINAGLGSIIAETLAQAGRDKVAGLYTTGGDTMVNVCYQMGVGCIEVRDYVIPQTDIGCLTGAYAGLPIVGKGGLTGDDQIAGKIVDRLFLEAARQGEH
ncbi:nucleotide-binding domain containing protein [Pseudoramibacter alactolyticus]|nr:nucleotide-binding domain containing protein [Pseudoramibacter alactolyticus]